jgi:predicted transcriptional regulator of viral defense system
MTNLPERCSRLAQIQLGVIARRQALECGMSADSIDYLVKSERWQRIYPGVFAIFTGPPSRMAQLWAAVLLAGRGAALSHDTAAELHAITDRPSSLIHVTIPADRQVKPPDDIVIHRSARLLEAVHPTDMPPRTKITETVLDLTDLATSFDQAFAVVCAACQRKLTTPKQLTQAMSRRTRLRWRAELTEALVQIASGVHSLLEYRYVRLVEEPHGLPQATRQAEVSIDHRHRYLDNLYEDYGLCVELDGQQAHPEDQRWADQHRINSLTQEGLTVLRYGWADVNSTPCDTATQIAGVLRTLGWPGEPGRCRPGCPAVGPS